MSSPSFAEVLEACTERCRSMQAPLAERLASFAEDVRRLDPAFADIVERMVERLRKAGAGEHAPGPGEPLPPFVLPDETGRLVSSGELLGQGPLVVAFLRGHWCPYCQMNADALAGIETEVAAAGGRIVVIAPELQAFTRALKAKTGAGFAFLTDLDNSYALAAGLAIRINDEKREAMTRAGWDISAFQDNASWTLPIPATFVVGMDGLVKARFVDPDYRKRMAVEDVLAALR